MDDTPFVVNVRVAELRKRGYKNIKEWMANENNIYIGRNMRIGIGNGEWAYLPKSKFHNPIKCSLDSERKDIVVKYEKYARKTFKFSDLEELRGKNIGCWCHPKECHGDILVQLFKEMIE